MSALGSNRTTWCGASGMRACAYVYVSARAATASRVIRGIVSAVGEENAGASGAAARDASPSDDPSRASASAKNAANRRRASDDAARRGRDGAPPRRRATRGDDPIATRAARRKWRKRRRDSRGEDEMVLVNLDSQTCRASRRRAREQFEEYGTRKFLLTS